MRVSRLGPAAAAARQRKKKKTRARATLAGGGRMGGMSSFVGREEEEEKLFHPPLIFSVTKRGRRDIQIFLFPPSAQRIIFRNKVACPSCSGAGSARLPKGFFVHFLLLLGSTYCQMCQVLKNLALYSVQNVCCSHDTYDVGEVKLNSSQVQKSNSNSLERCCCCCWD